MALVIPPGFGSAAFVFTGALGTPAHVTTLGVDLSGVGGDFVEAANFLFGAYESKLLPETYSALTLDHVTLAVGQDGPGGSVDSDVTPKPGLKTGTGVPVSMAPVVRKVTNEIGRRGRGRMFPPGMLATSEVDANGLISSGRITSLTTAFNAFFGYLQDGFPPTQTWGTPPVLLHSAGPNAGFPSPVTGFTVARTVGWIRGRIR